MSSETGFYEGPGSSDDFDDDPNLTLDPDGAGEFGDGRAPADLTVAGPEGASSLLEEFARELGRKTTPTVNVPLPGRPAIELVVRTDWSEGTFNTWRARAKDRRNPDGISQEKLARALLVAQTIRILVRGQVLTDTVAPGAPAVPWTLKSPGLWEFLKVRSAEQAVDALLPSFPHKVVVVQQVSEAAGQPDLFASDADPTGA